MSIGNPVSLTNNVAAKTISVTATTGQTLFTVAGGYRINQLSVYRNGTRLVDSQDYTARDGTTVTLLSPASGSDVIEFQVFDDFRVADALNVNSGGTVNGNVTVTGIVSATSFYGDGTNLTNTGSTLSAASGSQRLVLTSLTSGTMTASSTDADLTWDSSTNTLSATNVSIAGTLTYEDVTNVDSVGLVTARNGAIVNAGTATTALIVNGDARVTGILTIGTSSITLNGSSNQVNVGAGVTLHHTNGVQVGPNTLHSTGLTVNNLNATGILTAASFSGNGSGLIGVSSISQGNTKVEVTDTGSNGTFAVTTEGSERCRVDSSGRLLLGTSTSIAGKQSQQRTVQIAKAQASTDQGLAVFHFDNGGQPPNFELGLSKNNTLGSHTAVASGDNCGNIQWSGSDGTKFVQLAQIAGVVDGTPGSDDMPGRLVFSTTADGASSPTERLRITNSGRVCIGYDFTNTESHFLSVIQTTNTDNTTPTVKIKRQESSGGGTSSMTTALDVRVPYCINNNSATAIYAYAGLGLENTAYAIDAAVIKNNNGTTRAARFTGGHGNTDGYGTQSTVDIVGEVANVGPHGKVIGLQIYQPNYDPLQFGGATGNNIGIRIHNATTASRTYPAMEFYRNNNLVGNITTTLTATAFNNLSDYRLKENIIKLDNAAERLKNIPVHRFNFISNPELTVDGFLAHEVAPYVPESVTGEKDAVVTREKRNDETNQPILDEDGNSIFEEVPVYQQIDNSKLIPLLTAALQEALDKIDALQARLDAAGL